jgi:nuclear pore complex protein Nup54
LFSSTSSFSFGTANTLGAQPQTLGFGAPASTAAPAFNFSTTTTSSAPTSFGFGNTATSTAAAPSFGFGQPATSQPSLFGSTSFGFGAPAAGGFGTSTTAAPAFGATQGFSSFGQPQQQQQQQQALSPDETFSQSIFNVSIFGDERDTTLARWNYLQALLGTGKAFYSQSQPPVDINSQNYLCRFKAIGYNRLPGKDNKLGLVALKFNKPATQIKDQESQLIQKLSQLFGSRPNMMVHIDSTKPITDNSCQVVIYIEEKNQNSNETKRITATETAAFLNQPQLKYQLTPVGIEEAAAMIPPDEDQLKQYLDTPPKGIDPRMWRQAIADNPDPKMFIPVPLVGFNELKSRLTSQENETANHVSYLAKLEKDIGELKQRQANTSAKIMEHRRKFSELSHRILRIIVKQESTRKAGLALTPDEEIIKTKLENMHALVSAPTQFKGKLSELLSQMRMQRSQWASSGVNEYTLDKDSSDEMKNFLTMQQRAMELLIETVMKDMKDLKVITEGMSQFNTGAVM